MNKVVVYLSVLLFVIACIYPLQAASVPPIANFSYEVNDYDIMVNGSLSYDPDGFIVNYTWDFGDGSIAYGVEANHTYASEGIYEVSLTVRDDEEMTNSTSHTVFIDVTPPFTTYTPVPTPNGKNGWYVSNVEVELSATDNISGVKTTYYRIDGNNWSVYTEPFILTSEGEHLLEYYSIDVSGNAEMVKGVEIKIDKTPPHTIFNISAQAENGWYNEIVEVILIPGDSISGVDKTFYRIDGGEWKEYAGNVSIGEGIHNFQYFSIDFAGNSEKPRQQEIKIDMTPPEAKIYPEEGIYLFGRKLISSDTAIIIGNITVRAECSDNMAGVKLVEFYLDNSLRKVDDATPYEWEWNEFAIGQHEIKVIVYDAAGNEVTERQDVFIVNMKY